MSGIGGHVNRGDRARARRTDPAPTDLAAFLARIGPELQPWQHRLARLWLEDRALRTLLVTPRRDGRTVLEAHLATIAEALGMTTARWAYDEHAPRHAGWHAPGHALDHPARPERTEP